MKNNSSLINITSPSLLQYIIFFTGYKYSKKKKGRKIEKYLKDLANFLGGGSD